MGVIVMEDDLVILLDGNTFAISDRSGDMAVTPTAATGLFSFDTRFLSTWRLSINGSQLNPLSVDDLQYYESRFFLVPGAPSHYIDAKLSVIRWRSIGRGLDEQVKILNHDVQPVDLQIRMEVDSDFADPLEAQDAKQKKGTYYSRTDERSLLLGYERETFRRESVVSTTAPADIDDQGLTFRIRLEPGGEWSTDLHVEILGANGREIRASLQGRPSRARPQMRQQLDEWLGRAPRLTTDHKPLLRTYQRSLVDLASLRLSPLVFGGHTVAAAGLPSFMTIFGRDSLLTSLQALPFVPELAATTLNLMASMQGSKLDDFRDEEPGKIMREWRYGETAAFEEQPQSSYFGAADTTPLFLVLLDEYERWTGDGALVRHLQRPARAALEWIGEYGDLVGNGYIWYERRNQTFGLLNQCWKDSWNSISYRDGRLPGFPRATCELQGYAYDAMIRGARLARKFWDDPAYAERLEQSAAALRQRFNRDYWLEDRQYYALALDSDGTPVDALSSNIGHLLWSGIVEPERADKIVEHLLGPDLYTGWGVRTLAASAARFNPIGYHVGTVWPFDNSFIAWGLRRYGFKAEAAHVAEGIIDAAQFFEGRLPETFGGYDRKFTKYPVRYPTACSPQAWSAGTPLLLLRSVLGMEPIGDKLLVDPVLPAHIERIELLDIPGRWGHIDAFGLAGVSHL